MRNSFATMPVSNSGRAMGWRLPDWTTVVRSSITSVIRSLGCTSRGLPAAEGRVGGCAVKRLAIPKRATRRHNEMVGQQLLDTGSVILVNILYSADCRLVYGSRASFDGTVFAQ